MSNSEGKATVEGASVPSAPSSTSVTSNNKKDTKVKQETKGKDEPRKRGRPKDTKTGSEPKKKKAKSESKAKTRTPAKVDIDKQCGVPLVNNVGELTGLLCSRSLTCKTHSMGAKRAVRGRSRPYDVLLATYQRKNNLKGAGSGTGNVAKRGMSMNSSEAQAAKNALMAEEELNRRDPPLPPAEEVAAVMRGSASSLAIPLAKSIMVSTRMRNERIALREFLFKSAARQPMPPPPLPPAGLRGSSFANMMASTDAILSRCVMYNPLTNAISLRPSQLTGNAALNKAYRNEKRGQ